MGVLSVNHPDILEFINCKNDLNSFNNFNISVSVTDKFMDAVLKNSDYNLVDPRTKQVVQKLSARKVFENIIDGSWNTGDPGLIFIDKINKMHSLNNEIEATNPCGEQPLLAHESCVLGSINLVNFVKNSDVDWSRLKEMVFTAVHFLDNVIDANDYAVKEIEEITKSNRKIGLGVMGWADMLIKLGISYDSLEALELGEKVMNFIENNGRLASENLAKKRGNFPNFKNSKLVKHYFHQRNATITTIAPTGTISLIAGVSSGIEPIFGVSYVREVVGGNFLVETNKYFEEVAKHRGFFSRNLINELSKSGSLKNLKHVPLDVKKLFVTAFDIKSDWHVRMQAAFQKFTDNGVSKTINLSENATKEDVRKSYLLAYKLGCKGITIFRNGSKRGLQVLYTGEEYDRRLKLGPEFVGGCPIVDCGH